MPQPFSLFRLFFFNGFIVGKNLRFFTVHKGNGYHLFPLFRFGYENGGHRIGEDGHGLGVFPLSFRCRQFFNQILPFVQRKLHVNSCGFLIPDAHTDDGYLHAVERKMFLTFREGIKFNVLILVHPFPGGRIFSGNAAEAVTKTDFSSPSGFSVFSAASGFSCIFANVGDIKIHIHCFTLLYMGLLDSLHLISKALSIIPFILT